MEALKKVLATEIDSWLQFTEWNVVLSQSKHNMIKTHQFTCAPSPNEPELEQLLRVWSHILDQCLDTLAATDQKDALRAKVGSELAQWVTVETARVIPKIQWLFSILLMYLIYQSLMFNSNASLGRAFSSILI